jgi:hypothetical protein
LEKVPWAAEIIYATLIQSYNYYLINYLVLEGDNVAQVVEYLPSKHEFKPQ